MHHFLNWITWGLFLNNYVHSLTLLVWRLSRHQFTLENLFLVFIIFVNSVVFKKLRQPTVWIGIQKSFYLSRHNRWVLRWTFNSIPYRTFWFFIWFDFSLIQANIIRSNRRILNFLLIRRWAYVFPTRVQISHLLQPLLVH